MVNNGKVYVKNTRNYKNNAIFKILFQFLQFFQFRVFLIKKSCQFLCLVLVLAACIMYLNPVSGISYDKVGIKVFHKPAVMQKKRNPKGFFK